MIIIRVKVMQIISLIFMFLMINVNQMEAANYEEGTMGFMYQELDPNDMSTQVPVPGKVTVEDATNLVVEKGTKIVLFLQNIARPITLVVMVGCGLMAIFSGLFGGRDGGSGKWMLSAFVSSICYLGVIYAPLILQFITEF